MVLFGWKPVTLESTFKKKQRKTFTKSDYFSTKGGPPALNPVISRQCPVISRIPANFRRSPSLLHNLQFPVISHHSLSFPVTFAQYAISLPFPIIPCHSGHFCTICNHFPSISRRFPSMSPVHFPHSPSFPWQKMTGKNGKWQGSVWGDLKGVIAW